jgi:hypothetical protein
MSNLPPPQFPPPQPSESGQPQSHSDITQLVNDMSVQTAPVPWFKRPFLKLPVWAWLVALVALVGVGAGVGMSGSDDTKTLAPDDSAVVTSPPDVTAGVDTTVDASQPTITEPDDTTLITEPTETLPSGGGDVVAGAPGGERGTQATPVAAGAAADVGGGWRLQVLSFVADGTAAVAAENEYNEPPPAGKVFTLVKVALGYYGLEDPSPAYSPTINALGADKVQLETNCGLIPQELPVFTDVFAGGVVVGNLCYVTTPADAGGMLLYANADFFGGDDTFLAAAPPASGEPTPLPTLTGPQDGAAATAARTAPNPIGAAVDVGDGWSLTVVSGARDITDAVTTENSFNAPPPAGFRFVGVDVTYTYSGEGSDVALTATTKAVALTNVELSSECGVIPGGVDLFSDVFAGGSVTGTVCFVVPEGGFDMVLYTTTFVDDFVHSYFATK